MPGRVHGENSEEEDGLDAYWTNDAYGSNDGYQSRIWLLKFELFDLWLENAELRSVARMDAHSPWCR